jgi:hypothetical protein
MGEKLDELYRDIIYENFWDVEADEMKIAPNSTGFTLYSGGPNF